MLSGHVGTISMTYRRVCGGMTSTQSRNCDDVHFAALEGRDDGSVSFCSAAGFLIAFLMEAPTVGFTVMPTAFIGSWR